MLSSPCTKQRERVQELLTICQSGRFASGRTKKHCCWRWVRRLCIQLSNPSRQRNLNNTPTCPSLTGCVLLPVSRTSSRPKSKMLSSQTHSFGVFSDQTRLFVFDSGSVVLACKIRNYPSLCAGLIQISRLMNISGIYKSCGGMPGCR